MFDRFLYFTIYGGKYINNISEGSFEMSFNFFDKKKEYKAQWNFAEERINRGYDIDEDEIHTDVLGSYTGTPYDDSRPIQDADDL